MTASVPHAHSFPARRLLSSKLLACTVLRAAWPVLAVFVSVTLPAQEHTDDVATLQQRFRALDREARAAVSATVAKTLAASDDPVLRRISKFAAALGDVAKLPQTPKPTAHSAARWAPGAAPERTLLEPSDPKHAAVAARVTPQELAPSLRKSVQFHWGSGQIARTADAPERADDLVENALLGFAPDTDKALALALDRLCTSPHERRLGIYLGHLYADLEAQAYAGLTLFDTWDSGELVSVPDVDSIPFAREILKIGTFRSPIPGGPRRAWLYEQIRDATIAHRRYRALREAVALCWVSPNPTLDTQFSTLADRFHALCGLAQGEPDAVLTKMGKIGDRSALAAVFDALQATPGAAAATATELKAMTAMQTVLKQAVSAALDAHAAAGG